jgi:hypothetical protein
MGAHLEYSAQKESNHDSVLLAQLPCKEEAQNHGEIKGNGWINGLPMVLEKGDGCHSASEYEAETCLPNVSALCQKKAYG